MILAPLGIVGFISFPRSVTGDEFKVLLDETSMSSATTWQVYRESPAEYCFKLNRPLTVPSRYCVPKSDLRLLDHGDLPRYVYYGNLELREGRAPGAKRVIF
jgi:hypothetical protein